MYNKNKIKNDILNVLKNIISIDTSYPPGHTLKISKYIKNYLSGSNLNLSMHFNDKNKPNLTTELTSSKLASNNKLI